MIKIWQDAICKLPPSPSDVVYMTSIVLSFHHRCCTYDIYCTPHLPQMLYIWYILYSPSNSEVGVQLFLSPNSLIFAAQAEREATNWKGDKKENRNLSLTLPVSVYVMCLLSSQTLRTNCTFHHELELFDVCDDEMMVMMICRTLISQTSNSSSSSKIRITWDRPGHQKHGSQWQCRNYRETAVFTFDRKVFFFAKNLLFFPKKTTP